MKILLISLLNLLGFLCRAEVSPERIRTFEDYLKSSPSIVLVCIYNESLENRSLPEKHRAYREATIVRSIKGNWTIGQKIKYYTLIEEVPKKLKNEVGSLTFLFLDKMPNLETEFQLDTGSGWPYSPELDAFAAKIQS